MYVVAGKAKGKKLLAVPGDSTRPILTRVKTALFDTLRPMIEGANVLDLFGGTGAIGIEALSQGASHVTYIELNNRAIETIKKNLSNTGLIGFAEVKKDNAFHYLKISEESFDLIYVAPPQYKGMWLEALREIDKRPTLLKKDGLIVVQIDPKEYEEYALENFEEKRQKRYGNTILLYIGVK